jgi:benzoyl-CoA reductase/2-hydroxyglutaryl-CoA dehydratase subunit BcrC/BadD/HgdB
MALKKAKEVKGIQADYWRIYRNDQNMNENKTCVRLALYANKDARDAGVMNFLDLQAFTFDGVDFTREELYAKIKESETETRIITEAVPAIEGVEAVEAVLDEEGNVVTEAVEAVAAVEAIPAVTEEVELNWFNDAEDM